jgi:hypothetical protein
VAYRLNAAKIYPSITQMPSTRRLTTMFQENSTLNSPASMKSLGSLASLGLGSQLSINGEREEEPVDESQKETLKDELDSIVAKFLSEGSMKEINIPGKIRNKLMREIQDKKNYHPDIFRVSLEHTYMTVG